MTFGIFLSFSRFSDFLVVGYSLYQNDMLKKHLRMPIIDIPDPFGTEKSYARHHEVNVEKDGKKENVRVGWRGVKVEDEDGTKVNIQFIPIFLFVLALLGGFLFFIYKVLELIINW